MNKTQFKNISGVYSSFDAQEISGKENRIKSYPKIFYTLFYFFSIYLVLPIADIPFLGLSVSAPVMFLIAIPCLFKPVSPWFRSYQKWIALALMIWVAIFFSTVGNGLLSFGLDIDSGGAISIIRYLYWLLVFVITTYFTSQNDMIKKVARVLGWSILILVLLRMFEAVVWGKIGAGSNTRILSQNEYGTLFSTFSPFLVILIFQSDRRKRPVAILGTLLLLAATALNGSRGSWISIAIGLILALLLFFFSDPKKFTGLLFVLILIITFGFFFWNIVPQASSLIQERFSTFQNLEEDKSALIRELMIQKGVRLFKESPFLGVGADRFKKETVYLDIPKSLSYSSQEHYDVKSAHNSYIQYLAEFGLIGVIPYALLLLNLLFQGSKTVVREIRHGNVLPLAILLSFIQMSAHFWVVSGLTNTSAWFIYGLVGAMIMYYRKPVSV